MIRLPDGFALSPAGAAVALVLAAGALAGFIAGRRAGWPQALLAAALGMALFLVAVFVVQTRLQLLYYRSLADAVSPFWLGAHPWLMPLGLASLAGLCQESARLLAILGVRRGWPRPHWPLLGAVVGAGIGGIEAAMVLGAIPAAGFHLLSLAVLERVGAVAFHTGSGAVLGLGLMHRRTAYAFLIVLAAHTLIDFLAAGLSYGLGSLALAEAAGLAVALALYAAATALWRRHIGAGEAVGA